MKIVRVELGERSYTVHVGAGLLGALDERLPVFPHARRAVLVADANVVAWAKPAAESLGRRLEVEVLEVAAGERSKSLEVAGGLLEELGKLGIRRHDVVLGLGGGMVGDLAGFVGSVWQRGVAVVQLPTSLLAMVDAAIGGKTAVNLSCGKNLVGTFHQPAAVVADTRTLTTLPEREYRSGLAEVAKYGFSLDPPILDLLEANLDRVAARDPDLLEELVARSAGIKARIVAEDELDLKDRRAILNYGHTFGHALELDGGYERWLHGEAISVGLVFAATLAGASGLLDQDAVERHRSVLDRLGLPTRADFDPGAMAARWSMDKKHRGVQHWVLLRGIGDPVVTPDVGPAAIETALAAVRAE
ncbi:MAG TPA: 3-dehydroquinate synthase [Actinomycetota bacterium]|jgi:3-dehydroquinate synthase